MLKFTGIEQVTGIIRYQNLTRFEQAIKKVVTGYTTSPFLLSQWYNPGPAIIKRCTQEEIKGILTKLSDAFSIDLSMNFSKGLLFIRHFLLINREFDTDELLAYKKYLD